LKNSLLCLSLLIASTLTLPQAVFAQASTSQPSKSAVESGQTVTDQDIEMLRSDVRSQKKQIVAQNMNLTDAQAEKFWPVYDAYSQEVSKLNDTRLSLIKQYAESYDTMTDAQASSLLKQALALDESYVKLRQTWVPKFEKVISPKQTAAFFQLDRRIGLLIDLQIASAIPLVKQ
jgi:Spy/CpxP family protein refolding chaperone